MDGKLTEAGRDAATPYPRGLAHSPLVTEEHVPLTAGVNGDREDKVFVGFCHLHIGNHRQFRTGASCRHDK